MTVHYLKNTAAARLHGKMKMMAYLLAFSHIFDEFIGKILWMGGHKADPLQAFHGLYLLKKLSEGYRILQSLAVGVYVLSKEHDLCYAICNQCLYLLYNGLWLTAALTASYVRYDTVAAEVVSAEHDIYAGFK